MEQYHMKFVEKSLHLKRHGRKAFVQSQDSRCFKVKNDHRSKFSNLSNWKEEA